MSKNKDINLKLPSVDDLFETSAYGQGLEKIVILPIKEISDFPNHPYKVCEDEELLSMSESIKEKRCTTPNTC